MFGNVELKEDGLVKANPGVESSLLEHIKTGTDLIINGERDVTDEDAWKDEHTIRADLIRHICLNPKEYEMDPRGISIKAALISGELNLSFSNLTMPLMIEASRFKQKPNLRQCILPVLSFDESFLPGLTAYDLTCRSNVFLNAIISGGEVSLSGAKIEGNLECDKAIFINNDGVALDVNDLTCEGNVFLNDIKAHSTVRMFGAKIGGNLECTKAKFDSDDGDALIALHLTCDGNVLLNNVEANGEISFSGAKVVGDFNCEEAKFDNVYKIALSADGLTCDGNVFFDNMIAHGEVSLLGAKISGGLSFEEAEFKNKEGSALVAQRINVTGRLFWRNFSKTPEGVIDFMNAHVGDFIHDGTGWPEAGNLKVEGFTYDNLEGKVSAEQHIKWLNLRPLLDNEFIPQPYEHLIKVLRTAGHEHDAREIAIERQDAYRQYLVRKVEYLRLEHLRDLKQPFKFFPYDNYFGIRLWLWFIEGTIGYGYKPWKSLIWLWLIVLLGTGFFKFADTMHYMHVSKERVYMAPKYVENKFVPSEYPEFNALVYSIDALIPFVDLHQENYWEPKPDGFWGGALRLYFWLHIGAGWVLASMAAAGLTGLIKKD